MDRSPLCALGHVATRRDLETSGLGRREIEALRQLDTVVHPRAGIYACRHLSESERIAVVVGARLDCITVLSRHKIWIGHEKGLHLRMPPNASQPARQRLKQALHSLSTASYRLLGSRRIRVHWSAADAAQRGGRLEMPVMDALREAMNCLPPDDLIAALESALHRKEITPSELDQLIVEAPERLRAVLAQITPGAQSGYETKARLKLQRLGHHVDIQVEVPGVGHVDIVIDELVVLEVDGKEHHAETFEIDRERDVGVETFGLRGLRIPAMWVDRRWDDVLSALDRMIADARRARERSVKRRSQKQRRTEAEIFGDTPPPER